MYVCIYREKSIFDFSFAGDSLVSRALIHLVRLLRLYAIYRRIRFNKNATHVIRAVTSNFWETLIM